MTTPTAPPDLANSLPSLSTYPHILPPPFTHTEPPPSLVAQGAEALLFRTHFLTPNYPCALKYRPSKPYRHPILDVRLTRHRILSEARILVKCRREGVSVPGVLALDWEGGQLGGKEGGRAARRSGGWMMMEWVEGETVRRILDQFLLFWRSTGDDESRSSEGKVQEQGAQNEELEHLMMKIGKAVGRMHDIGVVHGDLTSSNLMLRPTPGLPLVQHDSIADVDGGRPSLEGDIVLIDFGLAAQSVHDEDKAVDLYVLERAFGSTHPTVEGLFSQVLKAYGESYRGSHVVLKKLEDVRMRGRKRSMIG